MRKLASIQVIDDILPIENADSLECAVIGGWKVVVRKGEYQPKDFVVYCEVDAFIPTTLAPFLTREGQQPKEYQGILGERLKTKKIRGQISQGLILPTYRVPGLDDIVCIIDKDRVSIPVTEGQDVSELLGIVKWVPPVDASLQGTSRGNFPYFFNKTDQERVQNIKKEVRRSAEDNEPFEVTEKLDGSSMSVYIYQGVFGVCSRNIDLAEDKNNTYWKVAWQLNLEKILYELGDGWVIQGELVGPKIQGNPYKLDDVKFYIFDIFDINNQKYLTAKDRYEITDLFQLEHVPIVNKATFIDSDIDKILAVSEGKSRLNEETEREGLVYKSLQNTDFSFKVISNKFLIKQK